ncbi:DEAD/DEAH box helicase family protein [bacterium]|nr:DEAD/DEAH box helicase family protein [bacterium]
MQKKRSICSILSLIVALLSLQSLHAQTLGESQTQLRKLVNEFRAENQTSSPVFSVNGSGITIESKFNSPEQFNNTRISYDWQYEISVGEESLLNIKDRKLILSKDMIHNEDQKDLVFDYFRALFMGDANLHPYLNGSPFKPNKAQIEALEVFKGLWAEGGQSGVFAMGTGLGKTAFAAWATDHAFQEAKPFDADRILIIVNSEEAASQFFETFVNKLKLFEAGDIGFLTGTKKDWEDKVVVIATNLTLGKPENLELFDSKYFDLIWIDEGHHGANTTLTYSAIKAHFNPRALLGLTATPFRGDSQNVVQWYGGRIHINWTYRKSIQHGYLTKPVYHILDDGTEYRIKDTKEIITDEERDRFIETALESPQRDKTIIQKWADNAKRSDGSYAPSVFSCTDQDHARRLLKEFDALGISAELYIADGKQGPTVREEDEEKRARLANGQTSVLLSVNRLIEAVDIPEIEVIVNVRRMKSLQRMVQLIGRGLRPSVGKRQLRFLDFMGNYETVRKVMEINEVLGLSNAPSDFVDSDEPNSKERVEIEAISEVIMDERVKELIDILEQRSYQSAQEVLNFWSKLYNESPDNGLDANRVASFVLAPQILEEQSEGRIRVKAATLRRWFRSLFEPASPLNLEETNMDDRFGTLLMDQGTGEHKSDQSIIDIWIDGFEKAQGASDEEESWLVMAQAAKTLNTSKSRLQKLIQDYSELFPDTMWSRVSNHPKNRDWSPEERIALINELFVRFQAQGLEGYMATLKGLHNLLKERQVRCSEKSLAELIHNYYYKFELDFRLHFRSLVPNPEDNKSFEIEIPTTPIIQNPKSLELSRLEETARYFAERLKLTRKTTAKRKLRNFRQAAQIFIQDGRFKTNEMSESYLINAFLSFSDFFEAKDRSQLNLHLLNLSSSRNGSNDYNRYKKIIENALSSTTARKGLAQLIEARLKEGDTALEELLETYNKAAVDAAKQKEPVDINAEKNSCENWIG